LSIPRPETIELAPPLPILQRTFSSYTSQDTDFWFELASYFQSQHVYAGEAVWNQGDDADALYVIESGELQATYIVSSKETRREELFFSWTSVELDADCSPFPLSSTNSTPITFNKYVYLLLFFGDFRFQALLANFHPSSTAIQVFEVMLAATVAGELSMMSRIKRNATVVAGQSSHLWKLDIDSWDRLEREKPEIAREFTRILLRSEFSVWFLSLSFSPPFFSLFPALIPCLNSPFLLSFSHCRGV